MGRWSRYLDADAERLPEGMRRIGYDADSETYTFKDKDGSVWRGDSGSQYGKLHLVTKATNKTSKKSSEPLPPLSPASPASGFSASPTSMLDDKKSKILGRSKSAKHPQPPPPYTQPARRFTDFDQLVNKDGRKKTDEPNSGFLDQVKRSFSVRNKRTTGSASRRGTV